MSKNNKCITFFLSLLIISGASFAADTDKEDKKEKEKVISKLLSFDALLLQVKDGIGTDRKEINRLVTEFTKNKNNQTSLLSNARNERNRLENTSKNLEVKFNANKAELKILLQKLSERLGALKELFGVLTQTTSSALGNFKNSVTQLQFPDRIEFLKSFSKDLSRSNRLPSIEDVERLWFEMHRELTESGKVTIFTTKVVDEEGQEVDRNVLRVGLFNIFSEGEYLRFLSENGRAALLPKQPQSGNTGYGSDIESDEDSEILPFSLDPTRGQLLAALLQTPSLLEQVNYGGFVGYFILSLGLLALIVTVTRTRIVNEVYRRVLAQLQNIGTPSKENCLGRLLLVYKENSNASSELLELKIDEVLVKEIPLLQKGVGLIKIITVVSPLLGLLGTVTGMVITFQAITLFGSGDPKLMAGGISQALVTTILGLVVAIPCVFMSAFLTSRIDRVKQILEEQSTGIIAKQAENKG